MHIICLTPVEPGVYNDHKADHITTPPDGWAYIPEDFPLPSTFPRLGSIEAEEIDGTVTVTSMTEGTLPEPVPEPEAPPTAWDEMDAAYQEGVNAAYE
jgi:hypothetical protein